MQIGGLIATVGAGDGLDGAARSGVEWLDDTRSFNLSDGAERLLWQMGGWKCQARLRRGTRQEELL